MTFSMFFVLIIFLVCLVFVITEKINKTIVVLAGATIFMLLGYVPQELAFSKYVDWNVIFLLIGMMILVGVIKDSGLFEYFAIYLAKKARGNPKIILIALFMISGILSAFFDSVSTCVIMAPVAILIAVELGISPLPFVISQSIASNIGGTATLIGDPANLMIASAKNFNFIDYIQNIFFFVMFMLILCSGLALFFFHKQLVVSNERRARIMEFQEKELLRDKPLIIYSIISFVAFLILLIFQKYFNLHASTIALAAAIFLIFKAKRDNFEHFLCREVQWGTILFFVGLFIMVGGLEESHLIKIFSEKIISLTNNNQRNLALFTIWIPGFIASFIDNVPYVATMLPVLENIHITNDGVWWAFILGSVLSANGTMIGSCASIVSVSICKESGHPISFGVFSKYSAIITVITFILSTGFILIKFF